MQPGIAQALSQQPAAFRWLLSCAVGLALLCSGRVARADKLRDLADVVGARDNQLVGYGVVTGLNGTGDDITVPYAQQSLRALMRRLGIQVDAKQARLRNVAAVIVTATIPAFVREGSRLDITVSSMGNAKSLRGGVLVQTPLRGADRKTYAVGQGPLVVGGFNAGGYSGSAVQENVTTTARVPTGALVEREIKMNYWAKDTLTLALRSPDFGTAQRVVEALEKALGKDSAKALDAGSVEVKAQGDLKGKPVELLSKLQEVDVDPVTSARVVINERTGTVVAGGDVRLLPVAIAQGGITIHVREEKSVSQPGPLAKVGKTEVITQSDVQAEEPLPQMVYLNGAASLADVAQALNSFGVSARELASILQALKAAGALRAEILVQ
jgi:flagellar P-ring protein precursor FlgI